MVDNVVLQQAQELYHWTPDYAKRVAVEYMRFLFLRSQNAALSPSNEIDKLWHQHILNTKRYRNFCQQHFGKFIDHDPCDAKDQLARRRRVVNSRKAYASRWTPQCSWNEPEIKVKLVYTFDVFDDDGNFVGKRPRRNSGYQYDGKVLLLPKVGTFADLKEKVSQITGHNAIAIKLPGSKTCFDKCKLSSLPDSFTLLLEEMSHNGYC